MIHFFLYLSITVFLLRWAVWGFVISKHGKDKPTERYNAFTHLLTTVLWGLLAYSLYNL